MAETESVRKIWREREGLGVYKGEREYIKGRVCLVENATAT